MLESLLILVESYLSYQFTDDSPLRHFFLGARELVRRKLENPRLFINDLIYSAKIQALYDSVQEFCTVFAPSGFIGDLSHPEKNWNAILGLVLEAQLDIGLQVQHRRDVVCPIHRDYGICIGRTNRPGTCGSIENPFDGECPVGRYALGWLSGERRGDR